MAGKLLLLRTREYNRVQQSCMGWPNECNIMQHRGKQKKCCIVQHLFSEKFDRDQTSYNKIQQDKTRYNKVAKRVQHFIKHQSCIMFYEMLYSFGRGLIDFRISLKTLIFVILKISSNKNCVYLNLHHQCFERQYVVQFVSCFGVHCFSQFLSRLFTVSKQQN